MVEPKKWYLISPPFCPWKEETGFIGINNSIGDELGFNQYEKIWRITKWWYDLKSSSFKYLNYNGPYDDPVGDSYPVDLPFSFYPGKGFWLYHMNDEPVTIKIEEGDNYNPQRALIECDPYVLSLDRENGELSAYMTGNPY